MLDADTVINNSSQKVGGSNAYPDPAPKNWVGPDPEKHIRSTPLPVISKVGGNASHGSHRLVAPTRVTCIRLSMEQNSR